MANNTNPWANGDYQADPYAGIATVSPADADITFVRCKSPETAKMDIRSPPKYSETPMNKHSTPLEAQGTNTRFPIKTSRQQRPTTSNRSERTHGPKQLATPPPQQFFEFGEKQNAENAYVHNTAPYPAPPPQVAFATSEFGRNDIDLESNPPPYSLRDTKRQNKAGLAGSGGKQRSKEEKNKPRPWLGLKNKGGPKQNAALISALIIALGVIGFIIFATVPTTQPEGMPEGVHLNETLIDR